MNIEVKILKDIPVEKLEKFADLTVYAVARNTLDYTLSENRFPYKSGNLQRSSMAQAVRKEKNATYCLDVPVGAEYAEYVWQFPQNVSWTNPDTYAQWYITTYKNRAEILTHNAVNSALRSVK